MRYLTVLLSVQAHLESGLHLWPWQIAFPCAFALGKLTDHLSQYYSFLLMFGFSVSPSDSADEIIDCKLIEQDNASHSLNIHSAIVFH